MFIHCCNSAWGGTDELQFNKRVHIFNIHLVRCYFSSGASRRSWYVDEKNKWSSWTWCWFTRDSAHLPVRVIFHLDYHASLPVDPPQLYPPACTTHPTAQLFLILPKSPPTVRPILHSFPWLDSEPWCWWGIHPPIFSGKLPDVHARPSASYPLSAWLSFSLHQPGHCSTLLQPNYGGATSVVWRWLKIS